MNFDTHIMSYNDYNKDLSLSSNTPPPSFFHRCQTVIWFHLVFFIFILSRFLVPRAYDHIHTVFCLLFVSLPMHGSDSHCLVISHYIRIT